MATLLRCLTTFFLLAAMTLHAAETPMKTVSIDEFFAGQLQPLPLKLDVPKDFVHASGLDLEESYTYWMLPKEIKPAAESGDLPKTGYVWGKISLDVGWLAEQKKFSHEDGLKAELAAAGHQLVTQKKRDAGGFAVMASTVNYKLKDGSKRLIYSAYIATNIETNCLFISYNPPSTLSAAQAGLVWDKIVDSISKK